MKKFILLGLIVLSYFLNVQAQKSANQDWVLTSDQSIVYFQGTSTDAIGVAGDSIWFYTVKRVVPAKQLPYVRVKLDSVKAGGTVSVILYGKETLNSPYIARSTKTWYMTTSDTTLYLTDTLSRVLDYTRVLVTASDDTTGAKINLIDYKIVED